MLVTAAVRRFVLPFSPAWLLDKRGHSIRSVYARPSLGKYLIVDLLALKAG